MIHTGPIRFDVCVETDCDGECDCNGATQERQFPSLHAAASDGFWWECDNCGRRTGYDDEDDDELPELDPVCTAHKGSNRLCRVFCTPACHDEAMAQKEAARNEKDR